MTSFFLPHFFFSNWHHLLSMMDFIALRERSVPVIREVSQVDSKAPRELR